jgi:membrane protease YdiL (CAAX protease family)
MAYYCYTRLRSDSSFDRAQLWNASEFRRFAPTILVTFAVVAFCIGVGVWKLAPERLFSFVRSNPRFWAVIMCFYPVVSVYPQSLIYRAFLFQRYRSVIASDRLLILTSAAAFSFAHIIFRNPIAIVFTLVGGLLFANRYLRSRSLLVSAFEHSLYGCFMFTIGLGTFFYHGAALAR